MEFDAGTRIPAAYVRGEGLLARAHGGRIRSLDRDIDGKPLCLPDALLDPPLECLTDSQCGTLLAAGRDAGLKLYRFKSLSDPLPRVKKALGTLRGLHFSSLLDVGSGRGAFLWPLLAAFPDAGVSSIELLPQRVEFMQRVRDGGIPLLHPVQGSLCAMDAAEKAFDIVTMLEVLEHIPDTQLALCSALRLAKRYLLISVPSKPDNNPEHIHCFTKAALTDALNGQGCTRLQFDAVNGHMLVLARVATD